MTISPHQEGEPAAAHRAFHREVRERLASLREASGLPHPPSVAANARQVVVIASSSRGGSSLLAEMLRAVPHLAHFPAEINPALRLADLTHPCTPSGSDALRPDELSAASLALLDDELSFQCGAPATVHDDEAAQRHALDLACRLAMQWPERVFHFDEVRRWLRMATPGDVRAFLRAAAVDGRRYDVPRLGLPASDGPLGPPGRRLVEEPPFVAVGPWKALSAEQLQTRPLVVKTPSNVYRLSALGSIFPRATLRVLHLTRTPAAAVNGLYDGWRHAGFFSHEVNARLDIAGYAELGEWARRWWKFDLPPGWRDFTGASLLEVCAFQWRAAHEAVLGWLDAHPSVDRFRLRFEDLEGSEGQRREALRGLQAWLGAPLVEVLEPFIRHGLPPVMATVPPQRDRWSARAEVLAPVLASPAIRHVADALGYATDL